MRYLKIYGADIANGPGFRVSLFVSGCARRCPGCFNPESWDPDGGRPFDEDAEARIFSELSKDWCSGLSILGGEPMSRLSDNRLAVYGLVKAVKDRYPWKTIWLYSGYTYEELADDPETRRVLEYVDVLVDGPYVETLKDLGLAFRGSSNQRIIDLTAGRQARTFRENPEKPGFKKYAVAQKAQ